jgi:hypothetical protein
MFVVMRIRCNFVSTNKETELFKLQKTKIMKAIINRQQNFGTLNGVITKNEEIRKVVNQHLKQGTAKLVIDTEETLMYILTEQKSNLHPVFEQALKPFGIY